MRHIKKSIIALCFFLVISIVPIIAYTSPIPTITDYHATFIPGYDVDGNVQIATRMYYLEDIAYFLLVDPNTLNTKILPVADFKTRNLNLKKTPSYYTMADLQQTPYFKALNQYSSPPYVLQNYGLTHSQAPVDGMFLTIDMCPSSKPFEEAFFKTLVALADKTQHPIPIALSMSGLWMIGHDKEFDWLIAQVKAKKLEITWINHSFSHIYYRDLPLAENFMLNRPEDFVDEILETEKVLLQKQQLPSVFFRYPGLVSDKELSLKLRSLGLIPVGSDAWLAKKQIPKAGSIILVHGNSNEPAGIEAIRPLLQSSGLKLLPIVKSIL